LTALPLNDTPLGSAITVNTVDFVDDLDTACSELARVAGAPVVGIGDPHAMARISFTSYGFTLRTTESVIAALQNAGWKLVERHHLAEVGIPNNLLGRRRPD
jgi:arsenite methyltransferase